jgi:hypothetical protein
MTLASMQAQRKPLAIVRGKLAMQVFSATLYGLTAISMNFVNKAVLREFSLSNVLLLNQICLSLVVLPSVKVPGSETTSIIPQ